MTVHTSVLWNIYVVDKKMTKKGPKTAIYQSQILVISLYLGIYNGLAKFGKTQSPSKLTAIGAQYINPSLILIRK